MKKYILSLIAVVGLAGALLAQPLSSSTQTNASVTAKEGVITSTNLTVFTLATSTRPYRVVVQNTSAETVNVKWSAVTGATNALAGCERLAASGTVGDKIVLEGVIPDPLVISAQAGSTNTATLNIHVLGRPK